MIKKIPSRRILDKRKRAFKGVTLIELIMVISIVGVLTAVASLFIKETIDMWRYATFRNELVSQSRVSFLRMMREIRQLRDNTSVATATSTRFRFYDGNDTDIDYAYDAVGKNITRNAAVLISSVASMSFTYYGADNAVIATPVVGPSQTNIKRVVITAQVSAGNQSKQLSLQIFPRCLL